MDNFTRLFNAQREFDAHSGVGKAAKKSLEEHRELVHAQMIQNGHHFLDESGGNGPFWVFEKKEKKASMNDDARLEWYDRIRAHFMNGNYPSAADILAAEKEHCRMNGTRELKLVRKDRMSKEYRESSVAELLNWVDSPIEPTTAPPQL